MTKMTELEKIVWTECVERLMPPDDATRERWGNEESMRAGATYGMAVQGVVPNMDMVNCFASFLPRAVPDQRKEQAEFGKRIVAMFYLELLMPCVTTRWTGAWSSC